MKTKYHMCIDCADGLKNAKLFKGCITVNGKVLNTVSEIRAFFQNHLNMGHRVIPCGDCDNFDWRTGCKGHLVEEGE